MAAATATAISAINATPPDAKAAMIMALTTAAVLIHLHIAMSLHKDLMIIHRNPASWVTRRRSKIASAFSMLESSASLQLSQNTCTPFSNFEDPLIASSVFLIVSSMLEMSSEIPQTFRTSTTTRTTILAHRGYNMVQLISLPGVSKKRSQYKLRASWIVPKVDSPHGFWNLTLVSLDQASSMLIDSFSWRTNSLIAYPASL